MLLHFKVSLGLSSSNADYECVSISTKSILCFQSSAQKCKDLFFFLEFILTILISQLKNIHDFVVDLLKRVKTNLKNCS